LSVERLVVLPEARGQSRSIERWWRINRTAAPDLFRSELRSTLRLIRRLPSLGAAYEGASVPGLRRLLMPRTRYHVYFALDEPARTVFVIRRLALRSRFGTRPVTSVPV
jgi:plasmid stabilization system protein ParE